MITRAQIFKHNTQLKKAHDYFKKEKKKHIYF